MKPVNPRVGTFKRFILNNRFVLFLLILLLIGLNILVFMKVSFIFTPIEVLIKTILLPIILAAIVYYLLNPVVDFFERRGIRRIYTILVLFIVIIGLLTILIVSVIPFLKEQVMSLIKSFPQYTSDVEQLVKDVVGSDFVNQAQKTLNINVADLSKQISDQASTIIDNMFAGIGNIVGIVKDFILALVTLPFILFYLLKDGKKIGPYVLKFMPVTFRGSTYKVMHEMNNQISSYIRGQIIVSFCIGALMYIGFLIIGMEYASLLALIAAFTSVVPYLGPAIAITPAFIIALVTSPFMVLKLIIVWTIVQLVEGKFISPQIMGRNLHIHPITIIFVILTAGNLFGVVGIILAVPGYAVLKVIVTHLFEWMKIRSNMYEQRDQKS
ncbi:AI-2E family transporter [Metabacillus idriensis]|uniref:AI-2E family transporter n=1 Tax=Metabacillus idriensis TaxID=324768 RepID=A0A6I2MHA4_9BACI|nr:AI-2E family transporter [Metabacillus idriensis]MCM3598823.1 AI-2E family transporter [Metabacillus idriensis]MRX56507.1 AI-2E family transporter [Metabacillus idriensis]OHR73498.1 AI-2E family transporter [Bacillus sp. HMSC76G11]